LAFGQPIVVAQLLLFDQLDAEIGLLAPRSTRAMLTRRIGPGFLGLARQPWQINAQRAHDFQSWSGKTRHTASCDSLVQNARPANRRQLSALFDGDAFPLLDQPL